MGEGASELLAGKVALVTGAARGIGFAVSRAFVEHGASVALADVAAETLNASVDTLNGAPRRAIGVPLDVTDQAQTEAAAAKLLDHFGRIDIVVANAGVLVLEHAVDMDLSQCRRVIEVNLTGAFMTTKVLARALIAQGQGR